MKKGRWSSGRSTVPVFLLAALTLGCLAPFLGKAIHMDDPLFVWCARHLSAHPLDFYGFTVNWEGRPESMALVTENPPLCSYYLALVGAVFGWSEAGLHTGFLFPAVAVVLGTYFLARRFCAHPAWAASMLAVAPGFILCGTSLMCDTLMLAFWIWSVVFWIRGLSERRSGFLALGALLASLAVLTKYFGLSLVPLLGVYSWLDRRRLGSWAVWLALPLVALGIFHALSARMYGESLVFRALLYATHVRVGGSLPSKALAGFAFAGGCFIALAAAAPWLWGRRQLLAGVAAAAAIGCLVILMRQVGQSSVLRAGHVNWLFVLQISLLTVSGASLLALAGADWLEHKSAESVLLVLWVAGTFVFTCAVNWTVSGRNILPMLPAAAALVVRRLDSRKARGGRAMEPAGMAAVLAISLGVALMVAYADFASANSARAAASTLTRELGRRAGVVKFEGHWGFQYYMQVAGAIPLDQERPELASNEVVVIPAGNSYLFSLDPERVETWFGYRTQGTRWLTLMSVACGAGYYSDGWGPLPFVFGPVPPEDYFVYRVK